MRVLAGSAGSKHQNRVGSAHVPGLKGDIEHIVAQSAPYGTHAGVAYSALRADYCSSTYTRASPLHPGHPSGGIPPSSSPRNLAIPIAASTMTSSTIHSAPQA